MLPILPVFVAALPVLLNMIQLLKRENRKTKVHRFRLTALQFFQRHYFEALTKT